MQLGTRQIGTTELTVTRLGMGGAPLGSVGEAISEEVAAQIIATAWDGGIRYFDTAPLYGHGLSEKRFGASLSRLPRDEFVISSKVGRLLVPEAEGERYPGMNDNEPFAIKYDYSYDAVMRSVESSLERLGLDRLDILLCHDIDAWTHGDEQPAVYASALTGALPAMRDLREQGVVSAIGLGVNEWQVCSRVMQDFDVDCFLLAGRYTLLEQEALDEMLPECVANDVSVIIGGPYNSGLLANADRRSATYDYKPVSDELWAQTMEIRNICASHNVDMRAAALQYPLRHPAVAAVIPGAFSVKQIADNLELVRRDLPDALWTDLADAGVIR